MEIIGLENVFGLGSGKRCTKIVQFCKGIMFKNNLMQAGKVIFQIIRMLFNKVCLQIVDKVFKNKFVSRYQKIEDSWNSVIGQIYRTTINISCKNLILIFE